MNDKPATVEVPVEMLKHSARVLRANEFEQEALDLIALLPKPKPRLVAVNLNELGSIGDGEDVSWAAYGLLTAQPDLLTLLERELVDVLLPKEFSISMARIRAALGVDQ